jgi:uncharacterized protein YbcI
MHREFYGRGAATTRTLIDGDYVVTVLEDVYTPAERTLIDAGEQDVVEQSRSAFQRAMQPRFTGAVEDVMGRKVIAFVSQVHFDPDLSVETFVLAPDGEEPEAKPS